MNALVPCPIVVAAGAETETKDDGPSDEAIRQADIRARDAEAPLVVLTVVPDVLHINPLAATAALPYDVSALREAVQTRIRQRVAHLTRRDPDSIDVRVLEGPAHAAVLDEAERIGAQLIVVGSHGRTGIARVLGSVAERIVRYASCPVLVARARSLSGHVLAATDFSDPAVPALRASVEEAARIKGQVTVAHCIDLTALDWIGSALSARPGALAFSPNSIVEMRHLAQTRIRAELAAAGGTGDALVLEGPPAVSIVEAAKRINAELIVVGTAGRTGVRRIALGSVAEAVVRTATTSVLVVRLGPGGGA